MQALALDIPIQRISLLPIIIIWASLKKRKRGKHENQEQLINQITRHYHGYFLMLDILSL
jgi:hypothetical protein